MEATLDQPRPSVFDGFLESLRDFPKENAARWSRLVQDFFDLERKEMLDKEPTPEALAVHRKVVRGLIASTHLMLVRCDPDDDYARQMTAELEGRLIQLKHSWKQFQEPMDPAEAERLIKQYFPE